MYNLTFHSLNIIPKNHPRLIHGSKTEIKKSPRQIFGVTIAYLKENSKIKNKFFKKNSYPEIRKTYFLPPKLGGGGGGRLIHGINLYMGKYSQYLFPVGFLNTVVFIPILLLLL